MPKVFVSYARDESKKVYRFLARLEQHGIKFWVDQNARGQLTK